MNSVMIAITGVKIDHHRPASSAWYWQAPSNDLVPSVDSWRLDSRITARPMTAMATNTVLMKLPTAHDETYGKISVRITVSVLSPENQAVWMNSARAW